MSDNIDIRNFKKEDEEKAAPESKILKDLVSLHFLPFHILSAVVFVGFMIFICGGSSFISIAPYIYVLSFLSFYFLFIRLVIIILTPFILMTQKVKESANIMYEKRIGNYKDYLLEYDDLYRWGWLKRQCRYQNDKKEDCTRYLMPWHICLYIKLLRRCGKWTS